MSVITEFCVICAGPIFNGFTKGYKIQSEDDEFYTVDKTKKAYEWLNDLCIIDKKNKVVSTDISMNKSNGCFKIDECKYYTHPSGWQKEDKNNKIGILCHKLCCAFLHDKFNYNLLFTDVRKLLHNMSGLLKQCGGYGIMIDYCTEDIFSFGKIIEEENGWLLESPFKNKKNGLRIRSCWKDLITEFKKK